MGSQEPIGSPELRRELDRVRVESDTLAAVIALVTSSPDLERVLGGVVDLLTRATSCHACFVYLRSGELLQLRAASHVYAHLVGKVEFGVEEGLAGWVAQRNTPAFIRENALEDPRTNYVPELEEERFQSMAAVPVRSRDGPAIGVIVLHTVAPREFDDATLNLLAHTAPLLAGAIENAQLYQAARRRVQALTELASITQRIASVAGREEVLRAASDGTRALLGCDVARVYQLDAAGARLELVACSPPGELPVRTSPQATAVLRELLRRRAPGAVTASAVPGAELELGPEEWDLLAVPVAAGGEQLGALVAASRRRMDDDAPEELLSLVASQLAVALEKAELIERLTEENIVRDLFLALEQGHLATAAGRASDARIDIERPHVLVEVRPLGSEGERPSWPEWVERVEAALRRLAPGAACDAGAERLRALLPLGSGVERELRLLDEALAALGVEIGAAIGRGEVGRGASRSARGLNEAADAAAVVAALQPEGGALAYERLGAYRYLVHVADGGTPHDPYLAAVHTIAAYDSRRGTRLVATLEAYLDRRSVSGTARALAIHPNTLRQRLDRIEALTELELAAADLLALELAVKLARLHPDARA